jgi:hypothetical protein
MELFVLFFVFSVILLIPLALTVGGFAMFVGAFAKIAENLKKK